MLKTEAKAMARKKTPRFSVTKAVKSNARDRIGSPPPKQVLPDETTKSERRTSKHKATLMDLLHQSDKDREDA